MEGRGGVVLARVPTGADPAAFLRRLRDLEQSTLVIRLLADARGLVAGALLLEATSAPAVARAWAGALGADAWGAWVDDSSSSAEAIRARGPRVLWREAVDNDVPSDGEDAEPGYWQPAVRALGEALASDVDLLELLDLLEDGGEEPIPLPSGSSGSGPIPKELLAEDRALVEALAAALPKPSPLQRVFLDEVRRQVQALGRPLTPGQRARARGLAGGGAPGEA
ncbi:MAG: hypothetical protein AB7N76_32560 [Planctomycetota bacterium]